uniref:Uncharacterized protein n=1 Tax=Triticum urartu TaxID=4572 RepID=A0A8R7QYK3_TRIUA
RSASSLSSPSPAPPFFTNTHGPALPREAESVASSHTVPGRSLLCCHAMIGDIFRYIAGEDEEEHADELPDKEPAFLPVERPHHAPACTVLPPQVAPGGPAPVRALMRSFNQQNGGRRR